MVLPVSERILQKLSVQWKVKKIIMRKRLFGELKNTLEGLKKDFLKS